jgi:hypothetical protein
MRDWALRNRKRFCRYRVIGARPVSDNVLTHQLRGGRNLLQYPETA